MTRTKLLVLLGLTALTAPVSANATSLLAGLTDAVYVSGPVLSVIASFMGFIFIGMAILKLATFKKSGGATSAQDKPSYIATTLFVGSILLNFGLYISTLSRSMSFNGAAAEILGEGVCAVGSPDCFGTFDTVTAGEFDGYAQGINFAFAVIQIVGAIALFKAALLARSLSYTQGSSNQGVGSIVTYLIGGTLAVNIKLTLDYFGRTMGGDAYTIIGMLINGV